MFNLLEETATAYMRGRHRRYKVQIVMNSLVYFKAARSNLHSTQVTMHSR
jgi:hypothetical protein